MATPPVGAGDARVSVPTAMFPCRAVEGLNVSELNVTGDGVNVAETETGPLTTTLQTLP